MPQERPFGQHRRNVYQALVSVIVLICAPVSTFGQEGGEIPRVVRSAPADDTYLPITGQQRIEWVVDGTVGPRSLAVGVIAMSWQTAWDTPEEWGRSWSGAGKRYLAREADVAISNTLEAGLGALWHEEPRYIRSHRHGVRARTLYAMKTVFLAQRADGRLAPAWGRYVANTLNNVIENAWLPPSVTTPGQTIVRSADGFLGRLIGNVYEEFWPDAKRLLHRRP